MVYRANKTPALKASVYNRIIRLDSPVVFTLEKRSKDNAQIVRHLLTYSFLRNCLINCSRRNKLLTANENIILQL